MNKENIFCPNEKCKYFQKLNVGNIRVKQTQGKCQPIDLMICDECKTTFSERKGTVYFGIKKSAETFDLVMSLLVTRISIKDIVRISKVSEDTIKRWMLKAAPILEAIQNNLLKELEVKECQVDELWSFVLMKKKTAKMKGLGDDDEIGDQWIFIAFDAVNKIVIHWKVGKRTLEDAKSFIKELKEKLASNPLFTTDELPAYEEAFLANFSEELPIERTGKPGRPRKNPIRKVSEDLKLAQVHKYRENGKVVEISTKYVFGSPDEIDKIINDSSVSQAINTSFIERLNGTVRAKVSRLVRDCYSFSKKKKMHLAHLGIYFVYYNLCWVHSRLKKSAAWLGGLVNKAFSFRELFELRCPEFICGH
jgi:IS1 family transposase/transposase-like protein